MATPLVSGPSNSIYSDYWRKAPGGASSSIFIVVSGRDVDLEAGFAPRVERTFRSKEAAEAFIAELAPLYDGLEFWIA